MPNKTDDFTTPAPTPAPAGPTLEERIHATLRVLLHRKIAESHSNMAHEDHVFIADNLVAAELARTKAPGT